MVGLVSCYSCNELGFLALDKVMSLLKILLLETSLIMFPLPASYWHFPVPT